jgi:hypothetical protein
MTFRNKTSMAKTKQVLVGRYYDKVKLQRALEALFPEENGEFGLRVCEMFRKSCTA